MLSVMFKCIFFLLSANYMANVLVITNSKCTPQFYVNLQIFWILFFLLFQAVFCLYLKYIFRLDREPNNRASI